MLFTLVDGIIVGTMYGLFALGIVLVYRGTKVINFAAPALGSLGLYITSVLVIDQGANWLAAAIVGALTAGAVALAFERFIVRPMKHATPLAVSVATIGLMLLIISTELLVFGGSPRNLTAPIDGDGFRIAGQVVTTTKALSIVVAIGLGVALTAFLRRTDFGLGVQAAAMDADAVRLVGVRLRDVNMFVWGLGGILAVIATVLVMPSIGGFLPSTVTSVFFVPSLAAALIGGLDDLDGAFIGGLVVGLTTQFSQYFLINVAGVQHATVLLCIVLVLLLAPGGVLSRVRSMRPVVAQ
ncbi:MAG: branched-chain amino acid transport system permease protein [Glaciecola sp.]|jgi:branched-chain amino acid transport system permease protein